MPTFSRARYYYCCFQVRDLFTKVLSHLMYTVTMKLIATLLVKSGTQGKRWIWKLLTGFYTISTTKSFIRDIGLTI